MVSRISLPQDEIASFCKSYHIRTLSLFGSALRDDFRADSDVDLLVEFDPDHIPGLITFSRIRLELSDLLGRQVDLQTERSLSRYFRKDVVTHAEKIYSAN